MVDNNLDTWYNSDHSCRLNNCVLWVQLDMRDVKIVRKVNIFSRNSGTYTLSNMKAMVGRFKIDNKKSQRDQEFQLSNVPVCGKWPGKSKIGELVQIVCSTPLTGSVVIIQTLDVVDSQMNIAEVKIYGKGKINNVKIKSKDKILNQFQILYINYNIN